MRDSEAIEVMRLLNAGFPRDSVEPETMALWMSMLCGQDAEAATNAALRIVAAGERIPSLAQFRLAYRQQRDRQRLEIPALEEETGERRVPPEVRAWAQTAFAR